MIAKDEVEEVIDDPRKTKNTGACINLLTYQAVFKMDRNIDKCRIVFDASYKNSEGIALNEKLLPGPRKQLDLIVFSLTFTCLPVSWLATPQESFTKSILKQSLETCTDSYGKMITTMEPTVLRF